MVENNSTFKKVAVLGAGVMGAQIAGHLANAGIPSLCFDLNEELANNGVDGLLKLKPKPLYKKSNIKLIERCTYDNDIARISECDWVIEVIAERLDWKHDLFKKVIPHLAKNAILTSNTSGLALELMSEVMPEDVKKRFFNTHFFNPPRYMKLVEVISSEHTNPKLVEKMVDFLENVLGKGVVFAKDTTNFIANRIGVYGMMQTIASAQKYGLSIEMVDKLTGSLIGRAKSATFRTADVVGLDTLVHVANNSYENCPDDEEREVFNIPKSLQGLIDRGSLGSKTKEGFYKKVGKDILSLDFDTLKYTPQVKKKLVGIKIAKGHSDLKERLRAIVAAEDVAGEFIWDIFSAALLYSANRMAEIAEDVANVDRAMRWGFGWEIGPFEIWDALGFDYVCDRIEASGRKLPQWIKQMRADGKREFYEKTAGIPSAYYATDGFRKIEEKSGEINLAKLKAEGHEIYKNWCASLIDIGDGVLVLEFHSVLQPEFNPIDGSILDGIQVALQTVQKGGFKGLIVGHQGAHFSAGANLHFILGLCKVGKFDEIGMISKAFQDVGQAMRFAPFPVIAAPHSVCLGGGFEVVGAADKIVASAELYCGAVEVGVGLIPGAGGNLRVLMNFYDQMTGGYKNGWNTSAGAFPPVMKAFETVGFAAVSMSAYEAIKMGYLKPTDVVVIPDSQRLPRAKAEILKMAENYAPPVMREDLYLPGEGGRLAIESTVEAFLKGGKISEHDAKIARKHAFVLTGGDVGYLEPVSEQKLLDLEREVFVELAQEPLSQARMAFMLKTGKPLRN